MDIIEVCKGWNKSQLGYFAWFFGNPLYDIVDLCLTHKVEFEETEVGAEAKVMKRPGDEIKAIFFDKLMGLLGSYVGLTQLNLRSSSKGDMKFHNCVVGGRLISTYPNEYDIVMTEHNWDDMNSKADGGYPWSYAGKGGNYGLNIDGVKYGEVSMYDK